MVDEKCPKVEYMFDNLLKTCSGAYRCKALGQEWEDASCRTKDFPICSVEDFKGCDRYKTFLRFQQEECKT
jgi:hypothetical protein